MDEIEKKSVPQSQISAFSNDEGKKLRTCGNEILQHFFLINCKLIGKLTAFLIVLRKMKAISFILSLIPQRFEPQPSSF